ncbi:MAG: cation:proton antiporter [Candidatus Bathyarchaeia archaeon]
MHAEPILILVSFTLLLSYLSSLLYSKTKIPDIAWLMLLGLIVGPGLNLFNKYLFLELAPMMSILALTIILFEAGINVDIEMLFETMGKSLLLSATSLLTVITVIGLTINYLLPGEFTLLQAMLLGAMIGGSSTVSVYAVLESLSRVVENMLSTRVLLTMESIISDPLCIVASITFIKMIMEPQTSLLESIRDIFSVFSLSTIFGLGAGILWAKILNRLRGRSMLYMLTLSALIPTYIASEHFIGEGGGAMTALAFGLSITNYKWVMEKFGVSVKSYIDRKKIREFHEEVTFFIKSFFFVYIGLIVSINKQYAIYGTGIALLLMLIRYLVVTGLDQFIPFTLEERTISKYVFAMGLPAFVMSQLPMIYDPNKIHFVNPSIYPDLCMPIVLGTVLYSSLLGPLVIKREMKTQEQPTEDNQQSNPNNKS